MRIWAYAHIGARQRFLHLSALKRFVHLVHWCMRESPSFPFSFLSQKLLLHPILFFFLFPGAFCRLFVRGFPCLFLSLYYFRDVILLPTLLDFPYLRLLSAGSFFIVRFYFVIFHALSFIPAFHGRLLSLSSLLLTGHNFTSLLLLYTDTCVG